MKRTLALPSVKRRYSASESPSGTPSTAAAVQSGGKNAPINGLLKLCSYDLVNKTLTPIAGEVTLVDATFSNGDDATIKFTASESDKFFKAKIEAK